jgi:predicted amidophosphoribosyltransferase
MKQIKARIKQKLWERDWKDPPRCILCDVLLENDDFMFCKKCKRELEAIGKNPEQVIKDYEKAKRRDKKFNRKVQK